MNQTTSFTISYSANHSILWAIIDGILSWLAPVTGRIVSVSMMASLLVVARTAPASEDGVQLAGVKRPRVLTVRIAGEPAETSGAVEEPGRR